MYDGRMADRSRNISLVHADLYARIQHMDELCEAEGMDVLFYCGLRSARRQAELFRTGRTLAAIERRARRLETLGFPGLARLLMETPPQPGRTRPKTCAAPGESWHQYGLAVDGCPIAWRDKRMVCLWDEKRYACEWRVYGESARRAGLFWAGDWKRFREYPHVQTREGGNPLRVLDAEAVRMILRGQGVEA